MTRNEVDQKEILRNEYRTTVSEFDGEYTKSTIFLLPAALINISNANIRSNLVNAYLEDVDHEHDYIRPIFVLFKTEDVKNIEWRKLELDLQNKEEFITTYSCGFQGKYELLMFVFKCPDEFKDDYYKFKRGKYSEFSTRYKRKFPEIMLNKEGKHVKSLAYAVINKTDFAKEFLKKALLLSNEDIQEFSELWSIPTKEREYYRYIKTDNQNENCKDSIAEEQCNP